MFNFSSFGNKGDIKGDEQYLANVNRGADLAKRNSAGQVQFATLMVFGGGAAFSYLFDLIFSSARLKVHFSKVKREGKKWEAFFCLSRGIVI